MIKCLVFDLDRCIADPQSGPSGDRALIIQRVLDILSANGFDYEFLKLIRKEMYTYGIENIINWHKLEQFGESIRNVYQPLIVPPGMELYPDFSFIKNIDILKVLVTKGMQPHQQSKIDNLGLARHFSETIIHRTDNTLERNNKQTIIKSIMNKHNLQPQEVMVIGDNPDDELAAGKELGMITVQTLRPRVNKVEGFDYYIASFSELGSIIQKI